MKLTKVNMKSKELAKTPLHIKKVPLLKHNADYCHIRKALKLEILRCHHVPIHTLFARTHTQVTAASVAMLQHAQSVASWLGICG